MPKHSRIDKDMFEKFCTQRIPEKEIAEYFGVDRNTVGRWCKRTYGVSFVAFSQQKRTMGKAELVNKALKLAERNGAVMIFLLKNWCGMKDSPEDKETKDGFTADMRAWFEKVKGRGGEVDDS